MFHFITFTIFAPHLLSPLPVFSLFIDGECFLFEVETTLGNPLPMSIYALSTVPL